MKTKYVLLVMLLTSISFVNCKENTTTTATEERIEANHPDESTMEVQEINDSTAVLNDSVTDNNMKNQSDTHGRDTDAGR